MSVRRTSSRGPMGNLGTVDPRASEAPRRRKRPATRAEAARRKRPLPAPETPLPLPPPFFSQAPAALAGFDACDKLRALMSFPVTGAPPPPPEVLGVHPLTFVTPPSDPAAQARAWHRLTRTAFWLLAQAGSPVSGAQGAADDATPQEAFAAVATGLPRAGLSPGGLTLAAVASGAGDAAAALVDHLCDAALEARGFRWGEPERAAPAPGADEMDEVREAATDDDEGYGPGGGGVGGGGREDAGSDDGDDDDDAAAGRPTSSLLATSAAASAVPGAEGVLGAPSAAASPAVAALGTGGSGRPLLPPLPPPAVDLASWRAETARVSSRLIVVADGRDWRAHADRSGAARQELQTALPAAAGGLSALGRRLEADLGRLAARERGLGDQFEDGRRAYREARAQADAARARHAAGADASADLERDVAAAEAELADLRAELDGDDGAGAGTAGGVGGGGALARSRRAARDLEREIQSLDVRIGLTEAALSWAARRRQLEGAGGGGEREGTS